MFWLNHKLSLGNIKYEYSDTYNSGIVIAQDPKSGSESNQEWGTVNVVVSKGKKEEVVQPPEEDDEEDIKFDHFTDALAYLWRTEKFRGLYKGIAPQLLKGVFVQGLLFTFKDQLDILFLFLLSLIKNRSVLKK